MQAFGRRGAAADTGAGRQGASTSVAPRPTMRRPMAEPPYEPVVQSVPLSPGRCCRWQKIVESWKRPAARRDDVATEWPLRRISRYACVVQPAGSELCHGVQLQNFATIELTARLVDVASLPPGASLVGFCDRRRDDSPSGAGIFTGTSRSLDGGTSSPHLQTNQWFVECHPEHGQENIDGPMPTSGRRRRDAPARSKVADRSRRV